MVFGTDSYYTFYSRIQFCPSLQANRNVPVYEKAFYLLLNVLHWEYHDNSLICPVIMFWVILTGT